MSTIPDETPFDTLEESMMLAEWRDEADTDITRGRNLRVPRVVFELASSELHEALRRLTQVPVARVMDRDFPRIEIRAKGAELRSLFASGVRSALVVDEAARPIGAVSAASVVRAQASGKPLSAVRVHDVVSIGVLKLPSEAGLAHALAQMAASPDLPIAVVGPDGALLGGFESHHVVAWLGAGVLAGS